MITNDKGIVELKQQILREVCRLAWNHQLTPDNCERLMLEIIPGPKPQYRCCIYKEREIVRGRIRLAMGLNPDVNSESRNVVSVIPAACDDCPIQDYLITDICPGHFVFRMYRCCCGDYVIGGAPGIQIVIQTAFRGSTPHCSRICA